jgi:hypothetical protein
MGTLVVVVTNPSIESNLGFLEARKGRGVEQLGSHRLVQPFDALPVVVGEYGAVNRCRMPSS